MRRNAPIRISNYLRNRKIRRGVVMRPRAKAMARKPKSEAKAEPKAETPEARPEDEKSPPDQSRKSRYRLK
jgi:hypothetical protein